MTATAHKVPEPPLGVIGSLASGFETVNARLELILLPLAMDLFLWLGPRLSIKPIIDQLLPLLPVTRGADAATLQNVELVRRMLVEYGERFNLFSVLSTAPIGLPSLSSGRAPTLMPGGVPVAWSVSGILDYILLYGAFVLIGLFLGAVYFGLMAQQIRDARLSLRRLFRQVWGDWARLTALAAVALMLIMLLGAPVLFFAAIVSLLSPMAGGVISLLGTTLALWVLFYLGFALHGIILQRRGLFGALLDSLRLVHRSLPHTASLYLVIILISLGLGALWNLPADDSWLLLVGLAGHAVVSTALMASTFAFYKDRYRWWVETLQVQRAQAESRRGAANTRTKLK